MTHSQLKVYSSLTWILKQELTGFKLKKQHVNTNRYQHFFVNRVANTWNNLPANVVSLETVNSFKNALDRHFSNIMYQVKVDY